MRRNQNNVLPVLWSLLILDLHTRTNGVSARGLSMDSLLEPQVVLKTPRSSTWLLPHHPFQVECTAWPDEGGTVHVEFSSGSDYMGKTFIIGRYIFGKHHRRVPIPLPMKLNSTVQEVMDPRVKRMKRTVVIKVCPEKMLDGGYINCASHEAKGAQMIRYTSTPKRGNLHFIDPPDSTAKVHYHLLPNLGILGDRLHVECSTLLQANQRQVFALNVGHNTHYWRVKWHDPYVTFVPEFRAQIFSNRFLTKSGRKIRSSVYIWVTQELRGAVFSCFTQDVRSNRTALEKTRATKKHSTPLEVICN
ncbi:hypothetical protein ElyMa_002911400 [Elysia marginata]|uniref:Copper type II ascorbate-dependent monooxygenase C-terminal domain-containing protein n=1 Tax=Elysia marginata TaxID=1093978 RepID=A0AAV4I284_9GAST|nr:hypothetical protein ElyMa_002911400 [Elysia marginata]